MVGEEFVAGELHLGFPLLVGLVIGLIEIFFVMHDEGSAPGQKLLKDSWHGFTFSVGGTLIASNVPWILSQSWFPDFAKGMLLLDDMGRSLIVSILITLIMLVKMVTANALKGMSMQGMKEKAWHKLVIALAVGFSPYYIFELYPLVKPYIGFIPFL